MTADDFARQVAEATGLTLKEAKSLVTTIFDQIVTTAASGEAVTIPGFGKFAVKDRPARQGRNPATGNPLTIAASKKLGFSPSAGVKERLGRSRRS